MKQHVRYKTTTTQATKHSQPQESRPIAKMAPPLCSSRFLITQLSSILIIVFISLSPFDHQDHSPASLLASGARVRPDAAPGARPRSDHFHYQTTYACEGKQLDLSCQDGKHIHLVRANYGRFSLSICNEQGHSNLSVQCASFRAFLIMETRCNKLSNCSVIVSKESFGDPCEETSKYLEVQYYCDDANNQQQQSSNQQPVRTLASQVSSLAMQQRQQAQQKQLQQQQQQATQLTTDGGNNNRAAAVDTAVVVAPDQLHKSPSPAGPAPPTGAAGEPSTVAPATGNGGEPVDEARHSAGDSVILQQQSAQLVCPPQSSSRNLYWNATRAGQLARQACPEGSSGKVSWLCDGERARFVPAWSPDFTQCRSNWLHRLGQQLDQMLALEGAKHSAMSPADSARQRADQMLKQVLGDLVLMARTKELFGEDLRRIDTMLGHVIAQFKSLPLSISDAISGASWRPNAPSSPFEELFGKLVSLVSSLFQPAQRNAWFELASSEERRQLELRLLNHLRDAGALVVNAFRAADHLTTRLTQSQPNVLAGVTVIGDSASLASESSFSLQLRQPRASSFGLNRFVTPPPSESSSGVTANSEPEPAPQQQQATSASADEFKIHSSVLKELVASGVKRFLVLDIKKPDYELLKSQLELAYANGADPVETNNNLSPLATGDLAPWNSRIFGVFAIATENVDATESSQGQQERRLTDLLAQWPISVDFKVSSSSSSAAGQLNGLAPSPLRQCNSLTDDLGQPNRCHTLRSNATNHVCRCEQFGFVSLAISPNQVLPNSLLGISSNDLSPWPGHPLQTLPTDGSSNPFESFLGGGVNMQRQPAAAFDGQPMPALVGSPLPTAKTQSSRSIGFWTGTLIALGLLLMLTTFGVLVVRASLRSSAHSHKQPNGQGFFAAGASAFLGRDARGAGGPTTGPLADHGTLMGDPLEGSATNGGATSQSTSIIGLNQAGMYHATSAHKPHQQLYAAHMPPVKTFGPGLSSASRWSRVSGLLLKPVQWLLGRGHGSSTSSIQHRVIGGSSSTSVSYKSQYQNGYTTGLQHHHQHHHAHTLHQHSALAGQTLPLAAPASSTSSYVSSSAYYEEIGPGNLTKVNTNQFNTQSRHTIVDPFKQQHQRSSNLHHPPAPAAFQSADQHQHHHHISPGAGLNQQQQQQTHLVHQQAVVWPPSNMPYSLELQRPNAATLHHQQQANPSYGQTLSMFAAGTTGSALKSHHVHNDLTPLQANSSQNSSSSSAGSQNSASTTVTPASGSTPRHYLFASPSAVNAYKSNMGR